MAHLLKKKFCLLPSVPQKCQFETFTLEYTNPLMRQLWTGTQFILIANGCDKIPNFVLGLARGSKI